MQWQRTVFKIKSSKEKKEQSKHRPFKKKDAGSGAMEEWVKNKSMSRSIKKWYKSVDLTYLNTIH